VQFMDFSPSRADIFIDTNTIQVYTMKMARPRTTPIQLEVLRRQIARFQGIRRHGRPVTTGCSSLDRILPQQGFRRGSLVEWLARGDGTAVETLAMLSAREASRNHGAVVVIDPNGEFYPPAAVRLGIDADRLVIVRTTGTADNAWALQQVVRCPGTAAVLAWPELHCGKLDSRTLRRLQLAAEQSGVIGLLIRPDRARYEPSWADVRLLIEPLPLRIRQRRRLRIHLLRCRGGTGGRSVDVEIDDETHTVYPAAELAGPANIGRATGA